MANKIIISTLSAILVAGLANQNYAADKNNVKDGKKNYEKCYGISKAGKNDCGSGTLACSGAAKVDSDKNAWILLPKGTCERIVGGNLKAGHEQS